MEVPMVVAVRCRALNHREAELGKQRFPSRSDCFYCCSFANPSTSTVYTVDPDSVFLNHRPLPEFSTVDMTNCFAAAPVEARQQNIARRHKFFEERHDRSFKFDVVFDEMSTNEEVYHNTVAPLVRAVRAGYNGTCFAYGMTGAGKTFTMSGDASTNTQGLCSFAISDIFGGSSGGGGSNPRHVAGIRLGDDGSGEHDFMQPLQHGSCGRSDTNDDEDPDDDVLTVHASYLEIYNERIRDLLVAPSSSSETTTGVSNASSRSGFSSLSSSVNSSRSSVASAGGGGGATARRRGSTSDASVGGGNLTSLELVEDPERGVIVQGLSEVLVHSKEELEALMERGSAARTKASTSSNVVSSRSHAVLQLTVRRRRAPHEQSTSPARRGTRNDNAVVKTQFLCGKLSLIDLAGSERASAEDAVPKSQRSDRRREGANINKSLLALGNCITVLGAKARSNSQQHVPYRDSKLTRLLKESLGGNTRTVMIATVTPSCLCYEETLSTLKYATRAKSISKVVTRNTVHIDEQVKGEQCYGEVLSTLNDEVRALRTLLSVTQAANEKLGLVPSTQEQTRNHDALVRSGHNQQQQQQCEPTMSHQYNAADDDGDWELLHRLQDKLQAVSKQVEQQGNATAAPHHNNAFAAPATTSVQCHRQPLQQFTLGATPKQRIPTQITSSIGVGASAMFSSQPHPIPVGNRIPLGGMMSPAPDDSRACGSSPPQSQWNTTPPPSTQTAMVHFQQPAWKQCGNDYYLPCDVPRDDSCRILDAPHPHDVQATFTTWNAGVASPEADKENDAQFQLLTNKGSTSVGKKALATAVGLESTTTKTREALQQPPVHTLGFLDHLTTTNRLSSSLDMEQQLSKDQPSASGMNSRDLVQQQQTTTTVANSTSTLTARIREEMQSRYDDLAAFNEELRQKPTSAVHHVQDGSLRQYFTM